LNELSVSKRDNLSMITVHAWLNGDFLSSYWADGLIIATATGSTAYSLSVGGPIVHPHAHNWVISPIAPHNLTVRPLVIPDDFEVTLKVDARGGKFLASVDSRSFVIDEGTEIKIRKADFSIRMIVRQPNFCCTLRNKLMWGADKRN
jgi:NAD+ kinase